MYQFQKCIFCSIDLLCSSTDTTFFFFFLVVVVWGHQLYLFKKIFTMLCRLPLHNNVNQPQLHTCCLPLEPPPTTHPTALGHHSARLGSLCYTPIHSTHGSVLMLCYFLHSSHFPPPAQCPQSIFYICVSILSLQILVPSPIPFF